MIQLSKKLLCQMVRVHDVYCSEPFNEVEGSDFYEFVDPLSRNFRRCRKGLITTDKQLQHNDLTVTYRAI
jgi:hypothetical protein